MASWNLISGRFALCLGSHIAHACMLGLSCCACVHVRAFILRMCACLVSKGKGITVAYYVFGAVFRMILAFPTRVTCTESHLSHSRRELDLVMNVNI